MADFDYPFENNLIDAYLNVETEVGPLPLHSHMSQDKFLDFSQTKTQAPKYIPIEFKSIVKSDQKQQQSNLHNCPKHLIKLIIQCIGLGKHTAEQLSRQFINCDIEVYQCIRNLLGILQMIRRNKLKSYSKQLLKIVFQNNSQNIPRLRLLQNPLISKVFEGQNPLKMCEAKDILKIYAINKLIQRKDNYNDRSKNEKKNINTKYLQLFIEQMRAGRIKQRISKQDKIRILQ